MKISYAVAAAIIALALTGCASTGTAKPDQGAPGASAAGDAAPAAAAPAVSWYDQTFGTFAPVTQAGTSDAVIPLPAGVKSGIISATFNGEANFIISVLDANGGPTIDGPVNTIGAYAGTTSFGMLGFGEPGTQLQVTGQGDWSITISPISAAPAGVLAAGTGDAVFLYDGAVAAWTFTHDGAANFIVTQKSSSPMPGININQIGPYSGQVPVGAGPSVVTLKADGNWTIQ